MEKLEEEEPLRWTLAEGILEEARAACAEAMADAAAKSRGPLRQGQYIVPCAAPASADSSPEALVAAEGRRSMWGRPAGECVVAERKSRDKAMAVVGTPSHTFPQTGGRRHGERGRAKLLKCPIGGGARMSQVQPFLWRFIFTALFRGPRGCCLTTWADDGPGRAHSVGRFPSAHVRRTPSLGSVIYIRVYHSFIISF